MKEKYVQTAQKNRIHQWFQNVDNDKYWWKGGLYEQQYYMY